MTVSIQELDKLPSFCGIYLVLEPDGTVVYVGQSTNIRKRWLNGHHIIGKLLKNDQYQNFQIKCVEVSKRYLNHAEYVAVNFYKPALNQKMPSIV